MAKILCLETSTGVCSVAIAEEGRLIGYREDVLGQNHSKLLTVFIDELLQEYQLKISDFSAVAVSEGPGSYTGLRIGVSAAKGICYGAGIPLIAINPLQAMASSVIENREFNSFGENDLLIPMIDARRMEVFMAVYNSMLLEVAATEARIIEEESFNPFPADTRLFIFGNGAEKCKSVLSGEPYKFIDGVNTSSLHMIPIAFKKFEKKEFVDVAYFEPFYLKDFVATVAKNTVLDGLTWKS